MKKLEEIFELLDGIIPKDAEKTIMYCEVENTAYEIFYFSYFEDGSCKHSSELIDAGLLDSFIIEKGFEKIADFIRRSETYDSERRNVITIVTEGTLEKIESEKYEKSVGLYKIKKDWKAVHLM